jgi:GDP-4-dehydro-6-deoxy-D-mannose reductase
MKKVLITGATGFVGKHLIQSLLSQQNVEVIGTYRSKPDSTPDGVTLEHVNLLDQEAVDKLIQTHKPTDIYHLAGLPSAAESFKTPADTITNNIIAELSILEALRKHELIQTKVLIVSTAEVYGFISPDDLPIDETTELRPVNPYAVSKIAQDYLGLQYRLSYRMHIVRVRPFNHIGPGQKDNFVLSSFAKQIVEIEKGKTDPIMYVGNLEAKRDFTDVRDMVRAYQLALEKGAKGDVYNIGSGVSRKVADMLTTMLELSTTKVEIKPDPDRFRPIDVPEIVCDSTKFQNLTGWQPEIPFNQTLQDILDYWRKIV